MEEARFRVLDFGRIFGPENGPYRAGGDFREPFSGDGRLNGAESWTRVTHAITVPRDHRA